MKDQQSTLVDFEQIFPHWVSSENNLKNNLKLDNMIRT